jgi:hypothetical protein
MPSHADRLEDLMTLDALLQLWADHCQHHGNDSTLCPECRRLDNLITDEARRIRQTQAVQGFRARRQHERARARRET